MNFCASCYSTCFEFSNQKLQKTYLETFSCFYFVSRKVAKAKGLKALAKS